MFTIIAAILCGIVSGVALGFSETATPPWSVFWGILIALGAQLGAGFWLKRKIEKGMFEVQNILQQGQKHLQNKVAQWSMRPPGSPKQAQLDLEREQKKFVMQALEAADNLEKWRLWSPLLGKQVTTLRMQLYFQIKDYKMVDKLMPHCLFLEPMTVAMRLARMYLKNEEGLEEAFAKSLKRLQRFGRGANTAILFALYSWILVQKGDIGGAHKTLLNGCELNDSETLKRNRDLLANNKINHFNNSGFGEEWYALGVEEPKIKMQRPRFGTRPF